MAIKNKKFLFSHVDEDHTTDVIEAIGVNVPNWEDLGIALQVKSPILEGIKRDNRDQVSACRREVIKYWLKSGTATWKSLCIALAKDYVGHLGLAKKIAEAHRVAIQLDHGSIQVPIESKPSQQESGSEASSKLVSGSSNQSSSIAVDSHGRPPNPPQQPSKPSLSRPIQAEDSANTLSESTRTDTSFDGYEPPVTNTDDHDQNQKNVIVKSGDKY